MILPPRPQAPSPSLSLIDSAATTPTHLLPSEMLAMGQYAPDLASYAFPRLPPPPPSTSTPPNGKSRNDLFSFDWKVPMMPNLSRAGTPDRFNRTGASLASPASPGPPRISIEIPPPSAFLPEPPFSPRYNPNATPRPSLPYLLPPIATSPTSHFFDLSLSPTHPTFPTPRPVSIAPEVASRGEQLAAGAGTSTNPILDSRQSPRLRMIPTRDYMLGEGRHASVYLCSYAPANETEEPTQWNLCAAKRILPDRSSQVLGLGEAFLLAKLATPFAPALRGSKSYGERGAKHILRLYGVKDERDGVETYEDGIFKRRKQDYRPSLSTARNSLSIGLGLPSQAPSSHPRSVSEAAQQESGRVPPLRRQGSFNSRKSFTSLEPPVGSPSLGEGEDLARFGDLSTSAQPAAFAGSGRNEMVRREKTGPRHSAPPPPRTVVPESPELDSGQWSTSGLEPTSNGARGSSTRIASSSHSTIGTAQETAVAPRIVLILEYCHFGSLLSFVRLYPERMGRRRWLDWSIQLCVAVAYCHERGLLHADIKPQNVLIAQDLTLRLADFGMSMFIPGPDSPLPPPLDPIGLGTSSYSPPEFVRPPPSPFSFPSDVFSLGVTLSVMLSGGEPYEGMRTVERMVMVGRGGYYEWSERRRLGEIGTSDWDGLSRNGSMRSLRSGRSSFNGSNLGRSNGAGGRNRSDSIESQLSNTYAGRRDSAEWTKGSWNTAALARRLLTPSRESGASDAPTHEDVSTPSPTFILAFMPPPSPTLHEFADHPTESDDDVPLYPATNRVTTYADGTPLQYFLSGAETVDIEIRRLIQSMTNPRAEDRPTAGAVLATLEALV